MKKYKVYYNFDGFGQVCIEAKSEKEAEELFMSGEFENEDESGDNSRITEIKED